MPRGVADLTRTQQALITELYHDHRHIVPRDDLQLDTPQDRGTFGSLVADGIYTDVTADDAALLAAINEYITDTGHPLSPDTAAIQRYEADIDRFDPASFGRLRRSPLLTDHHGTVTVSDIGATVLDRYADHHFDTAYCLTTDGAAMMADAPLSHRHPALYDAYTEMLDDGDPHDTIITISGERGTGTSTHAADLADALGLRHIDSGTWYRDAAADLGMTPGRLRRNRDWIEQMEDRNFDLENDAHTYRVAGSGDPLIVEGRLAAAALAADRGDGQPIAPVRIRLTCDDDVRAARYAVREDIADTDDPAAVTPDARATATEEIASGDAAIYGAFAETYAGIDPRDDRYYTHTVDNSGAYDDTQQELRALVRDRGLAP